MPQRSHLRLNSQIEVDFFIEVGEIQHLQNPGVFRVVPPPLISLDFTLRFGLGFGNTDSRAFIDAKHELVRK